MWHRRQFIKHSGLAALAASPFAHFMMDELMKKKKNFGVQLFTIPKMADQDLKGTLQLLSEIGYREVEFFGPYAFSAPETIDGWKLLAGQLGIQRNAFWGYNIKDVENMMKDYNLKAPSIHLDLITLRKNLKQTCETLAPLGVKYIVLPAITDINERKTLDHYKKLADEFSNFGKAMAAYDMAFVYHNHGFEHAPMNGEIPMDYLIKNTDPKNVKFELDIFWMSAAGGDPIQYLKNYPGRYKLLHIKDASEKVRFAGDGGTPDQWMAVFSKMADPGTGVFDIAGILKQAVKSGVEHFYLERDLTPTPEATLRNSFANLKKM
ncbi:MAG: sugar phosphate isomerase/epimerase family protein [Saprospiraceae bacterium]